MNRDRILHPENLGLFQIPESFGLQVGQPLNDPQIREVIASCGSIHCERDLQLHKLLLDPAMVLMVCFSGKFWGQVFLGILTISSVSKFYSYPQQ